MHGKVCWNELNTWTPDQAKTYYAQLFGWSFEEMPTPDGEASYWVAVKDGEQVAGIFTLKSPDFDGMPSHWFTYFAVEDMKQAIADNTAAGGKVFREPFDIPNVGTMAVIRDSTGAGLALMKAASD